MLYGQLSVLINVSLILQADLYFPFYYLRIQSCGFNPHLLLFWFLISMIVYIFNYQNTQMIS